jgi:ribonucleoside-diphosphate reductase alpha chain
MELSPEEHVDVQTTIQRWVDSSISKTINAPKGYTVKQVEKVYSRLYKKGAKGGTVYVDGSRNAQVLSLNNEKSKGDEIIESKTSKNRIEEIIQKHADIPSNKQGREIGVEVGSTCPICKEGVVEDLGGCNTCTNCNAQLKCGL